MVSGASPVNSGKEILEHPCPTCPSTEFVVFQFGLRRCLRCGLVVSPTIWDSQKIARLNSESFGDDYEPVASFWVRLFERQNNRRTLGRLRSNRGRLLELGVGSGSFLAAAVRAGFSSFGCDLSPAISRRAELAAGVRIHCGELKSMPVGEPFDVIVMNHVLEHVADPLALLIDARERLKDGGILHLAVPNVAAWEARLPGWNSYEPYHLVYFSPETVRAAVLKAGFKILSQTTHESFSGWFLAVLRSGIAVRRGKAPRPVAGRRRAPLLEHVYRVAMLAAGAASFPLRLVQQACGRGDEAVVVAVRSR